ncbi:MAG: hypothetical protein OXD34_10975 [bacterium]|nr:hypothetical protein [bacterium]
MTRDTGDYGGRAMVGLSNIVPVGIIDPRSRPPIKALIRDRTCTYLPRTLKNVAARGWRMTPRCLVAINRCSSEEPSLDELAEGHSSRCCVVSDPALRGEVG